MADTSAPAPGYHFERDQFALLLLRAFFPERSNSESALIRDFFREHLSEFDSIDFAVKVGAGLTPAPGLLPNVARAAVESSKKRIDVVAWAGGRPVLIEAKTIASHAVLGQLLTDRHLWMEQYPDGPEPRMVAIGRRTDSDSLSALHAQGIDVYIYPETESAR